MAAVKGVNATKAAAGFTGENIINEAMDHAIERVIFDTYEASALATTSTITLGTLIPVGARITGMTFMWDDMGSTVTFKAGDAGDDDRYIVAGTSVTTANGAANINATDGLGYVITGTSDTQIVVTTAGIWTGTFKMLLRYII